MSYQVFFAGLLFTASYHRPLGNPLKSHLSRAMCCTAHILPGLQNRGAVLLSCGCIFVSVVYDSLDGGGGLDVEGRVKIMVVGRVG